MRDIKIGLIGGTGLGAALLNRHPGKFHEINTPFGNPSDQIIETEISGLPTFIVNRHGPGHLLSPSQVPYRANIFGLKMLGVTHIIASGAVGSLREEFKPRQLVIPDQVIDKTTNRERTFFDHAAVHVDFAEPFCPVLRRMIVDAAGSDAHSRGCYVCMEGSAFSTRAESLMHRLWGGDLVGMTAMPEAKLAREAEMAYALVALVTDYDCWRVVPIPKDAPAPPRDSSALLREIMDNLESATQSATTLIERKLALMASKQEELLTSPALNALSLAIWSQKNTIPEEEVQRLAPLWIKYFDR